MSTGIQALRELEADDETSTNPFALTPLGKHLAELPCAPKVGRLLIYGTLLGCAGNTIFAFMS